MKISLILASLLLSFNCFAQAEKCLVGEDEVPVGSRILVTCETDPETKENVIVQYCYEVDGKALLSPKHAEVEPGGC